MELKLKLSVVFVALVLSGCGFKPMHAPQVFDGNGHYGYDNIHIVTVNNDNEDFLVKQALRERMGTHKGTKYILSVDPKVRRRNLGVSSEDIASRYDLEMTTKFVLRDAKTNKAVLSDSVIAVSTYGAPRDPYGTISAQTNAMAQVSSEIADRIINRVAVFYRKQGSSKSGH